MDKFKRVATLGITLLALGLGGLAAAPASAAPSTPVTASATTVVAATESRASVLEWKLVFWYRTYEQCKEAGERIVNDPNNKASDWHCVEQGLRPDSMWKLYVWYD